MKNVKVGERWYIVIDYHEYIANNLSQFGCVIFDSFEYPNFDFENLKRELQSGDNTLNKMYMFPLNVYSFKNKSLHTYWTFVNYEGLSSFMFFDKVRLACGSLHLNKFYACDFHTDKIFEMTLASVFEYGKLGNLKNLLKLDENNYIVGKWMKWCGPPGYSRYYSNAKVFRNDMEQEFYAQYGKFLSQFSKEKLDLDTFYSLVECKEKLRYNNLELKKITILEFDIDNPDLSINANILKAKNLNVRNIKAEEIFCNNLKCESVEVNKIYAESIECEEIKSNNIKTNFRHGIKFINSFNKKECEKNERN